MAKLHFITRPTPVTQLEESDLDQLLDDDWRQKAERLQVRRWRKLKREMF